MSMRTVIILASVWLLWALPSSAERVLYLDASDPGPDPATGWQDLSERGNHFANHGAQYDAEQRAFLFGGPSMGSDGGDDGPLEAYLELINEGPDYDTDFDFETTAVDVGTPFSVVVWLNVGVDPGDDFTSTLLQKGPSRSNEWKVCPRLGGGNTEFVFNDTAHPHRMFGRMPYTPSGWHLLVITHDGFGFVSRDPGDTEFFFNDSDVTSNMIVMDDGYELNSSIKSDAPVRVGRGVQDDSFFEGAIGFIEIWNEVLDLAYVTERYNGGFPARSGVEPVFLTVTRTTAAATRLGFLSEINGLYEVLYTGDILTTNNWTSTTGYTLTAQGANTYVFDPGPVPVGRTQRVYRVGDKN